MGLKWLLVHLIENSIGSIFGRFVMNIVWETASSLNICLEAEGNGHYSTKENILQMIKNHILLIFILVLKLCSFHCCTPHVAFKLRVWLLWLKFQSACSWCFSSELLLVEIQSHGFHLGPFENSQLFLELHAKWCANDVNAAESRLKNCMSEKHLKIAHWLKNVWKTNEKQLKI